MIFNFYIFKKQKGIGVIEIVIAIAVITIAFWGISQVAVLGLNLTNKAKIKMQAVYLAQEGLEAVRTIRDEGWATNVDPLTIGIDYFPVISGGKWTLTDVNPEVISGRFVRKVVLDRVYRNVDDNIADSGTEDTNTRKVTITVSWDSGAESYEIITYLTNFLIN